MPKIFSLDTIEDDLTDLSTTLSAIENSDLKIGLIRGLKLLVDRWPETLRQTVINQIQAAQMTVSLDVSDEDAENALRIIRALSRSMM